MSLSDIKNIVAWRMAYNKVLKDAAEKAGTTKDPAVQKIIESRLSTAAGLLLLDRKTTECMTYDKTKEHYEKTWEKNFKGTKEFTLIAITTTDPNVVQRLMREHMNEEDLKAVLDGNPGTTRYMYMESRPQSLFPPEISDAVLAAKLGAVVGPFETRGAFMLFYVKKVDPTKKKEFTPEFFETYKETARKDLINTVLQDLYKKYSVETFDVAGSPIDVFNIGGADRKEGKDDKSGKTKKDKGKKSQADLLKAKDDAVVGSFTNGDKKEKVTVSDLKKYYKVDSLLDEPLLAMAQQFNMEISDVIEHAIKLLVDGKVLEQEVKHTKYDETPEAKDKLERIRAMEIAQQYLNKYVSVNKADIKNAYNKFIKSIPEEEKNDNEIAVRMVFFRTREDASRALQTILSGDKKFGDMFKVALTEKTGVDLGYLKRRGTPPELWKLIKSGASGACCREVVEIDGSQFGIRGARFGIVYVADRRPVVLPSLSNPQDATYFKNLAEREKAIEIAKEKIQAGVLTVNGRKVEDWLSNREFIDRVLAMFIGTPG
jgi:hypothetical protein